MKKSSFMLIVLSTFLGLGQVAKGANFTNALSLKLKVSKFSVSTDPTCAGLITVYETSTPTYIDFLQIPTIGTGTIADGTYKCIAIDFSDQIKYTPSSTISDGAVSCAATTEYTSDVCGSGSGSFRTSAGVTGTCDNTDQLVTMYLSTASSETTNSEAFTPPTSSADASDSVRGFKLASPLIVSGSAIGTFVVNPTGKVKADSGQSACEMMPPLFSFSN